MASWYARGGLGTASPLLVWLGTVLLFSTFGPGGDVLLLGDWRTLVLFAAGVLPGAITAGGLVGRRALIDGRGTALPDGPGSA